jgi:hypothetical protein
MASILPFKRPLLILISTRLLIPKITGNIAVITTICVEYSAAVIKDNGRKIRPTIAALLVLVFVLVSAEKESGKTELHELQILVFSEFSVPHFGQCICNFPDTVCEGYFSLVVYLPL